MKFLRTRVSVLVVLLAAIFCCNQAIAKKQDKTRYVEYQQQAKSRSVDDSRRLNTVESAIAAAPGSVINGGFETGDFSGWMFGDNGLMWLDPWMVCQNDSCGYFFNNPNEGAFDALNGFDGEAGYEAYLYQDIDVPVEGAQISFYDRIQYDGLDIPSTQPRIYEVQVRDLNDNLLDVLLHKEIMLNNQPYTDLGWQKRVLNLSRYAGQMIRVYIQLYVPETFTGPAQIEFDDFQILTGPAPDADISGCLQVKGLPVAERPLVLWQEGEEAKTAETDQNGCYEFSNVASGKQFILMMNGPVVP